MVSYLRTCGHCRLVTVRLLSAKNRRLANASRHHRWREPASVVIMPSPVQGQTRRSRMAQLLLSPLHDLRRRAVCTLAVLSAVLAIALVGMAFGCPGRVSYRPLLPSLDAGDIDA